MPSPYPPGAPTVNGNLITVDAFLNNPARVQRSIEALTNERYIADVLFSRGPAATGGAVIYDQVLASQLYLERDVQEIEPGSEFPILNSGEVSPLVAVARKYGGEVYLTDEQVRRNNRALLARETTRLRNTIVRKVDTVAMAVLRAAPTRTFAASGDWSAAATDIIADLVDAAALVDEADMGYNVDTWFINPAQEADLLKDKDIREALPREAATVPIATGRLGRLLGSDFVVTNRVLPGEVIGASRGTAGSISDEIPVYAKTIADERREVTFIHGARLTVPYVTDPKAVVRITGA